METNGTAGQCRRFGKRFLGFLAMLSFCFIGYGGAASAYQWPNALRIATPAMGSNSYNVDLAWANLMEKETGMKVRLLPEESTSSKWATVKSGRFDMIQDTLGYIAGWMVEGREGFHTVQGGPFNARLFMVNQAMAFIVFTRGDTGIQSIYDFPKKGKSLRIIHWTVPAGIDIVQAVLAWVDMTVEDVTLVRTGSYIGATRMIAEGAADVSVFGIPAASAFMEAHANPHGLRGLPLDPDENPEGAKKFRQYMAAYSFPKNVAGPKEFVGIRGWGTDGGFVCRADMDEEWVYQMVKWTFENHGELGKLHPFIQYYQNIAYNKAHADMAFIPLHDGLVRYLKEQGQWSEANDLRQQYNIKLFDLYTKGYEECQKTAAAKRIRVDPNDQAWTSLWEDYKKDSGLPRISVLSDAEIKQGLAKLKSL
jgi:TRAP transporter TAXI family solute receptor